MTQPLRIAQVAPPIERVPPDGYGGTERVIYELVSELSARGHEVTTFASGDSDVPGEHVETVPLALRSEGFGGAPTGFVIGTMLQVLDQADQFDVIHSHLEWMSIPLARATSVPVAADVPRAARPAVGPVRPRAAVAGPPRGHQRVAGRRPPEPRLDRRPQRADAERRAVRSASVG